MVELGIAILQGVGFQIGPGAVETVEVNLDIGVA
jgi:hypothetical protein